MSILDSIDFAKHEPSGNALVIEDYQHLLISGLDAASFLQGQLTADVEALDLGASCFAAHCNPKGRMISSFLVFRLSASSFLLRVVSDLADEAAAQLKKYMVFSKVELSTNSDINALAIWGDDLSDIHTKLETNNPVLAVHKHAENYLEICASSENIEILRPILEQCKLGSREEWQRRHLTAGIADISAASSAVYLPQELNFDHIGAVSFKKGCYTGQEVIARLHYKGKLKKRLYLGETLSETKSKTPGEALKINSKLYNSENNKACGQVVAVSSGGNSQALLAVVENDSVISNTVVTSPEIGAKIEWHDLPYAIP